MVEVPEFTAEAQYFETQLYWLKDGAWVKVNANCGTCNIYPRSANTPTINYIHPGNAMNIYEQGCWTSWKSLDDPNDTNDIESGRAHHLATWATVASVTNKKLLQKLKSHSKTIHICTNVL